MAIFLDQIQAAIPTLLDAGYRIVSVDERPDVFGNTCVALGSNTLEVRLIFDRGQFFADVSLTTAAKQWFALQDILVSAAADGSANSPAECVDAILRSQREIVSLLSTPDRLRDAGLVPRG